MHRLSRRRLLLTGAAATLLVATPRPGRARAVELGTTEIGYSQGGRPLVIYHLGDGWVRLFLLGGQHGGPEANTTALTWELLEYFVAYPEELPPGVGVDFMPEGNPDGLAIGSRQYLSGVDPNRNWGGPDWSPDTYDSNGAFRPGLGGPEPFSEPETAAFAAWLEEHPPDFLINYHCVGGFAFGGGGGLAEELAETYTQAAGYPRVGGGTGRSSPLGYRASGTMNGWLREIGVPSILVELASTTRTEFDRNLAGIYAVLPILASLAAESPYQEPAAMRRPRTSLFTRWC